MSEAQLHANSLIRNFRPVGTGGRLSTAAVKHCLTPAFRLRVTGAALEGNAELCTGRKNGGDDA